MNEAAFIKNEIAQGLRTKDIAKTYAIAIQAERAGDKPDWHAINAAIVARWRMRGLDTIKRLAWNIVEETTQHE